MASAGPEMGGEVTLFGLLDALSLPFLKLTFEEYGILSFDDLPATEQELELALRELGCVDNDRHRIISVKRNPALLSVMQRKEDAGSAHMLRRRTAEEKALAAAAAEGFASEFLKTSNGSCSRIAVLGEAHQELGDTSVVFCSFSSPLERGKKGSIHVETLGYLRLLHDAGAHMDHAAANPGTKRPGPNAWTVCLRPHRCQLHVAAGRSRVYERQPRCRRCGGGSPKPLWRRGALPRD